MKENNDTTAADISHQWHAKNNEIAPRRYGEIIMLSQELYIHNYMLKTIAPMQINNLIMRNYSSLPPKDFTTVLERFCRFKRKEMS